MHKDSIEIHPSVDMNLMRGARDESPRIGKDQQHNVRHQQQRLSQPDRINTQSSR